MSMSAIMMAKTISNRTGVAVSRRSTNTNTNKRYKSTLILLRHGKSIWNGGVGEARFTGWADVPLTVQGRVEAVAAGLLLRHRGIKAKSVCVAFASELERSHETCELVLASMAGHKQDSWSTDRIRRDWRLNERHWGIIQGRYKNDPELIQQYGEEKLLNFRRSLKGKPPPLVLNNDNDNNESNDNDIDGYNKQSCPNAPLTESLYDCQRRVVDCWTDTISKTLFDETDLPYPPENRTIMVVAHANTIRALMAHFDDVDEEQIPNLFVPNSVPILYNFDDKTRKPFGDKLESHTKAGITSHARWMLSVENHSHIRNAITTGGMLTRALFDFMDVTKDGKVCRKELEAGIHELQNPENDNHHYVRDCVVVDVAKKCAFEMKDPNEYITFEEFERRTTMAYNEIQFLCEDNEHSSDHIEWV
jgi:2,3-bisphosphoglycerate-dependent phosphoglycerate mutase